MARLLFRLSFALIVAIVVTFFGFSAPIIASAQVVVGIPPFQSFGGGPDVINLGNLNVHYSIPVFSRAGRGMPFSYALAYGSSVYGPLGSAWYFSGGGLTKDVPAAVGYVNASAQQHSCIDRYDGSRFYWNQYIFSAYTDSAGTLHPFGILDVNDDDGTCGLNGPHTLSATATDGSGMTMTVYDTPGATITLRNGQVISPVVSIINSTSNGQTDSNGNEITTSTTSGVTSFYDTLSSTTAAMTISGTAPSPVSYKYFPPSGTQTAVVVSYKTYTVQTNFGCTGITEYPATSNSLVDKITLPDGSYYQFGYEKTPISGNNNVTGRIASLRLPTGGTISYDYTGFPNNGIMCTDGSTSGFKRTTPDGQWTYSRTGTAPAYTTTITDPQTNVTVINFNGNYETQRKIYQGAATGTPLEAVVTCYNGTALASCPAATVASPFTEIRTYRQFNGGSQASVDTFYNGYALVTERDEYDFGASTATRKTTTSYGTYNSTTGQCTALGNGIVDHPCLVAVTDGSGNVKAETAYSYDENAVTGTTSPNHASVTGSRGNLTTLRSWTSSTASMAKTFTYYDTGMINTATDVNGAVTTYQYGSGTSCGNSFPTETDHPLSLTDYATWNCTGAVMATAKDINLNTTTTTYTDAYFWRPAEVSYPDGGDTKYVYNTTTLPWDVATTRKMNGTVNVITDVVLDGLGRAYRQKLTSDPNGTVYTDTAFDPLGRVASVTNPYYTTGDATYGVKQFSYDALGRVTKVTNPDGTYSTSSYNQRAVLSTDESGIKKAYQSDGLGRLQYVCDGIGAGTQANNATAASCNLDVTASGFLTTYGYDVLGNITSASVGAYPGYAGQSRSFAYDELSRLLTETNPEIGVVSCNGGSYSACYAYDTGTAGGLYTKISPKPNATSGSVTATYAWDALYRPVSITFSDGSLPYNYTYDRTSNWNITLANTAGRLVEQERGSGPTAVAGTTYTYDTMGRVLSTWSCQPDNCGQTPRQLSYSYNLLGQPVTSTVGNGAYYFTNTYNGAGELTAVANSLVDTNHPANMFSGGTYNALGKLTQGTYGDGAIRTAVYDNLGRLTEIQDGSTASPVYRLYLSYFGNSSVKTYNDTVGGGWSFTYDAFNRLATSSNGTYGNAYSYTYDQLGNRWKQTLTAGSGITVNYSFNNNNRNTTGGFAYDGAGNLTSDGSCTPCWTYDMTGNLTGGGNATFTYDGLNHRVEKVIGTATLDYLVDLNGKQWDEYQGSVHSRVSGGIFTFANGITYFNHNDHLNSPRVTTDHTGTVLGTATNLPFGDGFSETALHDFDGFAGGEWDAENNADQFGFREYAATQARWLTPDPAGLGAVDPANPQSWNRYAYVGNSPVSFTDPMGLWRSDVFGSGRNGDAFRDTGGAWFAAQIQQFLIEAGLNSPIQQGLTQYLNSIPGYSVQGGNLQVQNGFSFVSHCGGSEHCIGTFVPYYVDLGSITGGESPANNVATISAGGSFADYCNNKSNQAALNVIVPGLGDSIYNYSNVDVAQKLTSGILSSFFGFGTAAGQAMSWTANSNMALTSIRSATGLPKTLVSTGLTFVGGALTVIQGVRALNTSFQTYQACTADHR